MVIANDDRSHNGRYRGNRQDRIHCVIQSVCRAIAHNRFDSSRIPRMPCKWGCCDQRTSLRCAHFRRCPTDRQPYPGSTIWTGDRGKSIVAAHRGGERHAAGAAAPDFTASRRRTHRQLEFLPRRAPDARASLYARSGRRLRPRRPAREELEGKAWTPGAHRFRRVVLAKEKPIRAARDGEQIHRSPHNAWRGPAHDAAIFLPELICSLVGS